MAEFKVHSIESAPEESRPFMEKAKEMFGFTPNVLRVQAEAPALIEGYMTLSEIYSKSSFSKGEQQIILMCVSYENNCHYCMAAHTGGAMGAGVSDEIREAVRAGTEVPEARINALCTFVKLMVEKRGWLDGADVDAFLEAGFTNQNVLEIVLGIAVKTMTHYANHIAGTVLDDEMSALAWTKPE